jgi:adenylate kinase
MAMFLVLLGPPGVGKGTQAERLAEEMGLPHISSGELFRENIRAGTPLGKKAQSYIDRGELVPDEVTIGMVADRLSKTDSAEGALLDGFPRTIEQAQALDQVLAKRNASVTLVPYINAATETLLQRLGGRWTCRNCQVVYHILFSPPSEPGKCDACGGELYQRPDDTPETHRKRIQVYQDQTAPLIEFYRERGLLVGIDGETDIDGVYAELLAAVQRVSDQGQVLCEEPSCG